MQLTSVSLHHDHINQQNIPIRELKGADEPDYISLAIMPSQSTRFESVSLISLSFHVK